jgi:hypothetical protein
MMINPRLHDGFRGSTARRVHIPAIQAGYRRQIRVAQATGSTVISPVVRHPISSLSSHSISVPTPPSAGR